ncbi:MAG TPA: phosphohistidine phosphatase SixA [Acidobacteriota bacterium]
MIIYLVRHAIAQEAASWQEKDETRPLTREGMEKMREIAAGLSVVVSGFDQICTSPLIRARQTAEILAQQFKSRGDLLVWEELVPGAKPHSLEKKLTSLDVPVVALVGHEPHLGYVMSYFLTGKENILRPDFKKAGVCCMEYDGSLPATLLWFIPPKISRTMKR